jgi:hypothetical protein
MYTAKNLSAVPQIYSRPFLSLSIFYTMKVATVLDRSSPLLIILRQSGIISVVRKKVIAF